MILDDDEISTKSLAQLESILAKKPDKLPCASLLWYSSFWTRAIWLAQPRFIRAHQLQPRSILATYRLARNYHKLGDYNPMLPLYHELLRQRPDRFHYINSMQHSCSPLAMMKKGCDRWPMQFLFAQMNQHPMSHWPTKHVWKEITPKHTSS